MFRHNLGRLGMMIAAPLAFAGPCSGSGGSSGGGGGIHIGIPVGTGSGGSGPACYDEVKGTAQGGFQGPVKAAAQLDWRNQANNLYGFAYSHWNKAQSQSENCSNDGKRIKTWTCEAKARPCK